MFGKLKTQTGSFEYDDVTYTIRNYLTYSVVNIGGVGYFTLQEAIDSLDNVTFKTITLLESIDECVVFDNKLAIIDFNDFSINCGSGNGYAIEIKNNSHVVFNGKVGSSSSTRIGSVRITINM